MKMNNTRNLQTRYLRIGLAALLVLPALFFGACSQNAIFYNISQEVELRDPTINGSPTNIVEWDGGLYAANFGSLYRYADPAGGNDKPVWSAVAPPAKPIWGLAATKDVLYVLTDAGLYKKTGRDSAWEGVSIETSDENAGSYPNFQNIYADAKRLFVGSSNGYPSGSSDNYAILYTDDTGKLRALETGTALLSGAAFDGTTHFVSTLKGIFTADETAGNLAAAGPVAKADGTGAEQKITGIICLGDSTIVAINRDGALLKVTKSAYTDSGNKDKTRSTGALAIWRTPPSDPENPGDPDEAKPHLLLLGIQGSISSNSQSYVNGYREIVLNAEGGLNNEGDPQIPGDGDSSISNRPKYESSLGMLPVNHIFQTPYRIDKNMTLFAAVHGEQGLWSYRDHGSGEVNWNAESN
jgi:hypothetical protein